MKTIKVLDTLTTLVKTLDLQEHVKIYLCGVTVYDDSHIGHARTIIIFDVLRRYLEEHGHTVSLVQNFTDVDDKIISKAKDTKQTALEISQKYIQRYHHDFDALYIKRATHYPLATTHIPDMILFIEKLVKQNIAYVTKNGVYFAVSKFSEYGKLSKKKIQELQSGARIKVDQDKQDPLDFALWKFTKEGPTWDSPWGKGRPGWHLECSAMSLKYLGTNFDIHGGGRDLIFPHHENEIAQSESYTKEPLAKVWMHVGMVTVNGEKMSKSLGNVAAVQKVLSDWGPNVIKLFCLSSHYSKPIDYSGELLRENLVKWRQIEIAYYELINASAFEDDDDDDTRATAIQNAQKIVQECKIQFEDALDADFNTHQALLAFFTLIKQINKMASTISTGSTDLNSTVSGIIKPQLDSCLEVLGLHVSKMSTQEINEINDLIIQRKKMRQENRYDIADQIRDKITAMNVELLDHGKITSWVKKEKIAKE